MALCVGFDTSNYTTSAAWWDGREGRNESRILDVPQGALGLRQSDALFLHVRRLPEVVARLLTDRDDLHQAKVVAASSRPRAAEDSYMPCFLAGVCEAKTLASVLGAEYMEFSHQQGHLAAAALQNFYWCSPKTGCLMRKKSAAPRIFLPGSCWIVLAFCWACRFLRENMWTSFIIGQIVRRLFV